MSKISDKMNIATADSAPRHQHPAIFSNHYTSQCFLRPAPVLCMENIPKRTTHIKQETFMRFQPMPKPVFGRATVANRCFFVPFRTVFRHFNNFIESTPVPYSISSTQVLSNVPLITNLQLLQVIMYKPSGGSYVFVEKLSDQNSTAFDFVLTDTTSPTIGDSGKFVFNGQGRYLYKVLRSLGYGIVFDANYSKSRSVLPLCCFMKVYLDWYHPSAFAYNTVFANLEQFFDNCTSSSTLPTLDIVNFFTKLAYCSYDQDYFTSSWVNPVGPNASNFEGAFSLVDVTNNASSTVFAASNSPSGTGGPGATYKPSNGTPYLGSVPTGGSTAPYGVLTQYVIDSLRSLSDYTVRHRLSGVRTVDRYLSEYGISLSNEIAKRSIYLGYDEFPCQFGDNMSTADTTGAPLGSYSGKGIGYDRGTFTIDGFAEMGMIIIVNTVVPQTGYWQGYDRHVDHIYPLDFYKGDFDHLGVQAISVSELYTTVDSTDRMGSYIDNVFGYVPRYAEYHVYNDHVTGLPSLNSVGAAYDAQYLGRDVGPILDSIAANSGAAPTQRLEFVLAYDFNQFERIVYSSSGGLKNDDFKDFIDVIHHFTIDNTDTAKDLFEVYDFEKHVNSVRMNVNGTNLT